MEKRKVTMQMNSSICPKCRPTLWDATVLQHVETTWVTETVVLRFACRSTDVDGRAGRTSGFGRRRQEGSGRGLSLQRTPASEPRSRVVGCSHFPCAGWVEGGRGGGAILLGACFGERRVTGVVPFGVDTREPWKCEGQSR